MLKDVYELQKVELMKRAIIIEKQTSRELAELKALKADFDAKKLLYAQISQEAAVLEAQLDNFPKQIQELDEQITAQNQAIYDGSIKNTKELAAREAQVTALRDKLAELNSLKALYQGEKDQKTATAEELKEKLNTTYERFGQLKTTFTAMQQSWQERLDQLDEQQQACAAKLSEGELAWFESIKEKFDGSPVAMLSNEQVCHGCHTIVPPITFKRTKLGQKTFCEKCGRTLFVEE